MTDTNTSNLHTRSSAAFSAALASEEIENIPRLEAVFSNSVNVEAEHEEECLNKFGASIHSSYSSKEAGRIAYSCISIQHYHLCEESVLTEIVDSDGRTLPFGEVGAVLVTPYMCAAMPLIRDQQGDRAAERNDCLCGKQLRTISAVEGRTHFLFHSPSGQKFAASVPDWLRVASGVSGWQVAQVDAALIEVRYMGQTELTGFKLRDAHDTIFKLMRSEFEIQFKRVGELQETDAGKFIKYVNEYVLPK